MKLVRQQKQKLIKRNNIQLFPEGEVNFCIVYTFGEYLSRYVNHATFQVVISRHLPLPVWLIFVEKET